MAVVARMKVSEVALRGWDTKVTLRPVITTDDPHSEEIAAFFAATPSGEMWMSIKNEVAAEQFQPGDDFYVSLEKVPASAG
jgi:hypothetical protein